MDYYDKDVIKYIDPSIVLHSSFDEWYLLVEDILLNDEFQKRKYFIHHHELSVWDHSVLVSFKSFLAAKYFNADSRVCAIAGLLHDFYPQAWQYSDELSKIDDGRYLKEWNVRKPLFKMHGFTHAREAMENSKKFFPELINDRIMNSIKCHMFPLNIVPPKYKEGFIVTGIDKLNSVHELPSVVVIPKKVGTKAINILFKRV